MRRVALPALLALPAALPPTPTPTPAPGRPEPLPSPGQGGVFTPVPTQPPLTLSRRDRKP